jgi:hypothetical protein
LTATVFYTKEINGRLYPKAARTGPYPFAQEVSRVDGKVVTRYIGIERLPNGAIPSQACAKAKGTDVIEKGRSTPTAPANPNRFSRNYSDFRISESD